MRPGKRKQTPEERAARHAQYWAAHGPLKLSKAQQYEKRLASAVSQSVAAHRKPGGFRPFTTAMEYTPRQLEFMGAIEEFKRITGRKFPTWSEALALIDGLGYVQVKPCSDTSSLPV